MNCSLFGETICINVILIIFKMHLFRIHINLLIVKTFTCIELKSMNMGKIWLAVEQAWFKTLPVARAARRLHNTRLLSINLLFQNSHFIQRKISFLFLFWQLDISNRSLQKVCYEQQTPQILDDDVASIVSQAIKAQPEAIREMVSCMLTEAIKTALNPFNDYINENSAVL